MPDAMNDAASLASASLPYQPRCPWTGPTPSEAVNYESLSDGEFRVLSLDGYNTQGVLKCSLQKTSHAEASAYTAISYTWNEAAQIWYGRYDTSPKPIWIDGKVVRVIDKVANVLCLALQHGRQLVWIDTICINQTNAPDKNHQVAQMGKIYSGATDVLCFLNRPTARTDAVLDKIRSPSDKAPFTISSEDYVGCLLLVEDEYWGRAWTLQESVLAKEAFVCSGSKIVPFLELVDFQKTADKTEIKICNSAANFKLFCCYILPKALTFLREGKKHAEMLHGRQAAPDEEFLDVLRDCQAARFCTDPRDLIYSRLALSPKSAKLVPYPDYTLSVEEVYKSFAANCILLTNSIDVITLATKTSRQLPSWVPDWTVANPDWKLHDIWDDIKRAIEVIPWLQNDLPRVSSCLTELMVQGKVLSTVRKRDPILALYGAAARHTAYRDAYESSEHPKPDDLICVLKGCPVLVFLRPVQDYHIIVGRNRTAQRLFRESTKPVKLLEELCDALRSALTTPEVVFGIR